MDSLLSTNSAPTAYYRQLDKMVKAAQRSQLDYTQLMKDANRDGRLTLDIPQFETVVKSMDPLIAKSELTILQDHLRDPSSERFSANIVVFSRELDKMAQNIKLMEKFFTEVNTELTKKGMSIEQFFQTHYNSRTGSMAPTELEKCLKDIKFEQPPVAAKLLFMALNEFESDFKIGQAQFIKLYEEFNSKHSTNLKATPSRTVAGKDESIQKIAPELHKLREAMMQANIDRLKVHFQKNCKIDQGHITQAEFENAIREIMPTITFREISHLCQGLCKEGKVDVELPDEFIRESARFMPNSKSSNSLPR